MNGSHADTAEFAGVLDKNRPILIRQAHLVTMDNGIGDLVGDLLIKDGKIAGVGPSLSCDGAATIDGRDKVVIPGFVNSHIHL